MLSHLLWLQPALLRQQQQQLQLRRRPLLSHLLWLQPALLRQQQQLLLLSAGFDGAHLDQGNLRDMKPGLDLQPEDFLWLTEQLVTVANLTANGRVVSVLEGGYGKPMAAGGFDRSLLASNCQAHVAGLAGVPFEPR